MDPNDLRDCVEREIKKLIEPVGVETLRGRQQGRAGVAANHSEELGAAMSRANSNLFQNTRTWSETAAHSPPRCPTGHDERLKAERPPTGVSAAEGTESAKIRTVAGL